MKTGGRNAAFVAKRPAEDVVATLALAHVVALSVGRAGTGEERHGVAERIQSEAWECARRRHGIGRIKVEPIRANSLPGRRHEQLDRVKPGIIIAPSHWIGLRL